MQATVHVSAPAPGVAQLLMETGPRNFSSWALNERLRDALTQVKEGGVRVVVIGSAVEGFFISHGNLQDNLDTFSGKSMSGDPRAGLHVYRELDTGPMISVAAVDGQAWGGGAELAWACDLRVASARASFAQPEVHLGVTTAAGGATRLARIAGEATALRMVLDGRPVLGEEAYRLGLVHRLVPEGRALAEAVDWAAWLASRPEGALANAKKLIIDGRDRPVLDSLKEETRMYVETFSHEASKERARAALRRYDEGGDSFEAFGIPRP